MPVLLKTAKRNDAMLSSLICESMQSALDKYRKNTTVRFRLRSNDSLQLIVRLIPDFTPHIVRRGYFYI